MINLCIFLFAIFVAIAIYQILAISFKLPSYKISSYINRVNKASEGTTSATGFLDSIASRLSVLIPIGMVKKIKIKRLIATSGVNITPEFYVAKKAVISLIATVPSLLLLFISPYCVIVSILVWVIAGFLFKEEYRDKAKKRTAEIERELPRFISNFTASIKYNRNVIDIIDTYKANYDTELTKELSITVADMRTGSSEQALNKLEARLNIPLLSELVRGILASLRGEDMSSYFDNLNRKIQVLFSEDLKQQVQKIEPKISGMSIARGMWAMLSLLIAMIAIASNLTSGGLM